jgi:hypothetical protein
MAPAVSDVNAVPTVTALGSPESDVPGVSPAPHSEHGQLTFTVSPADGVSMLPLSSTARDMIVVVGTLRAAQV